MSGCWSRCCAGRATPTLTPRWIRTTVCALHLQNHYDLILLDLLMPGMDGFAVLEAAQERSRPTRYVPVLVITAQPGHKLRALQAGAKDFISKPIDLTEAKARIHNMLEVRLLYRQIELHNQLLEQHGTGTDRRTADQRRALSPAHGTLLRLVLGAGCERQVHRSVGAGPGDARHRRRGLAHPTPLTLMAQLNEPGTPASKQISPPDDRSSIWSTAGPASTVRNSIFQVSGEPIFNQSGRYIGYRGIGMEVTERMHKH